MSALRGIVGGVLGLSLLDAVVSSSAAANNVSTFTKLFTGALARLVDPTVPLIPDKHTDTTVILELRGNTMKKVLTYGGGLIALYLVVNYASGTGTVLRAGAAGGTNVIKALQGRG